MPPAARLLFVLAAMSFVAWTIVAVVHVAPWLARWPRRQALLVVLTPQMFRHVGALALFPGIGATPPEWSVPLAWGDAATSIMAMLAMIALYRESRAAIPLAWAVTIFGTLDLLHNGFNAAHLGVASSLGPIVYVVVIAVPGMLTAHLLAFRLLLRPS